MSLFSTSSVPGAREINLTEQIVARYENNRNYKRKTAPTPFGWERAEEIIRKTAAFESVDKFMSDGEAAFVKCVWNTMPGHTCFYDALLRILGRQVWQENGTYFTSPVA
jgi:hypothetical protein